MRRRKKQQIDALLTWFYQHQRAMPWRENPSPYRVWISEVMLQQTTVATVHNYFQRFMEKFPSLDLLAQASEEDVLLLWAGLGYYSRAKNILKSAQFIQNEQNFPTTYDEIIKLSGVGAYTAAAICSIAYGQAVALVDTNVDRVLGRVYALQREQKDFNKTLQTKAQELMDCVEYKDIPFWNQAVMELGSLICSPKNPQCELCPMRDFCEAFSLKEVEKFPGDKKKIILKEIQEIACVYQKEDRYFLQKIETGTKRTGLYDFVLGTEKKGQELFTINYRISNNKVERTFFLCDDEPENIGIWMTWAEIQEQLPLVSPCKKFFLKYTKAKKIDK